MILPDTNILVAYFDTREPAASILKQAIAAADAVFSPIVVGEFLVKATQKQTMAVHQWIDAFGLLVVDRRIMEQGVIYRKTCLHKIKRVQFLDCLIAATAKIHGATVVTYNRKDYPFSDLSIRQPEEIESLTYPVRKYRDEDIDSFFAEDEKQTKKLKRKKFLP